LRNGRRRVGVSTHTKQLDMEQTSSITCYLKKVSKTTLLFLIEFYAHTRFRYVAHWRGQGCSYLADWIEFLSSTYQFKLDERKMLFMSKLTARTAVLWVITGLVIGSVFASSSDLVRQNPWFIVYEGLVGAWLFVLTGIASIHLAEKK